MPTSPLRMPHNVSGPELAVLFRYCNGFHRQPFPDFEIYPTKQEISSISPHPTFLPPFSLCVRSYRYSFPPSPAHALSPHSAEARRLGPSERLRGSLQTGCQTGHMTRSPGGRISEGRRHHAVWTQHGLALDLSRSPLLAPHFRPIVKLGQLTSEEAR